MPYPDSADWVPEHTVYPYSGGGVVPHQSHRPTAIHLPPARLLLHDVDNPHPSTAIQTNRKIRGKLPKATTDFLKAWLHAHREHPYPTDDEKRRICAVTGLSMSQVSNWMINARRRILKAVPPMSAEHYHPYHAMPSSPLRNRPPDVGARCYPMTVPLPVSEPVGYYFGEDISAYLARDSQNQ